MRKVEVIVEYADSNLSAYIKDAPIVVVGNSIKEIETNTREAIEFYLEDNDSPCEVLCGEIELVFKVDVATFINFYSGFSGTVTFTNAARVREAAAAVPRDKLLIETDAPYLAPHPNRGKLNHSGYLTFVLDVLAQIWNCSPEDAALQTYQNAIAFFELP